MKVFKLTRTQQFKLPLEEVWSFFSSPNNLKKITPSSMDFTVRSELPEEMYSGMIIEYQVRPIASIPLTWVSEITQFQEPNFFIDEQKVGPYSFWHHQHHFKALEGGEGTEVTDVVHYCLPLGIFGRIAHWLFIAKQLNAIFDYRHQALRRLLPSIEQ